MQRFNVGKEDTATILISPGMEKVQSHFQCTVVCNLYDTGSQAHDHNGPHNQRVLLQSPETCALCCTILFLKLLLCGTALDTMSQIGGRLMFGDPEQAKMMWKLCV